MRNKRGCNPARAWLRPVTLQYRPQLPAFCMAKNPQGQSDATRPKQEALSSFISAHSKIVEVIQGKYPSAGPYVYIETNAGSGWNDEVDCIGSPLVALEALGKHPELKYKATFIERKNDSAAELLNTMAFYGHTAEVINKDHAIALPSIRVPPGSFGLVYADPNALKDAPVEALKTFFTQAAASRIDVLFNLDAHMLRRVVEGQRKGGNPGNYDDLAGLMRNIPKKDWWIRQPFVSAGSKWIFLFGSNTPKLNIKGLGKVDLPMFPVASPTGSQILAELMGANRLGKLSSSPLPYRTYREYLAHPQFLAVRAEAMSRSAGICELCQDSKASEVHHRIYPRWGTFDEPEALIAVCHECHCKAHGVTE